MAVRISRVNNQPARLNPPIDPERDHISGPFDASIQLLEFGDYECPYCRKTHAAIKETQERFGADFCYTFRHLPNLKLRPPAELAAKAAPAQSIIESVDMLANTCLEATGLIDCVVHTGGTR